MASNTDSEASLILADAETDVLALYDQLQLLGLELALLALRQGRNASESGGSPVTEQGLASRQTQLLEAKAVLALRNSVVESVVAVQPILNAVHHATDASPVERDLSGNIELRDKAAIKAATTGSALQAARSRLAELEIQNLRTSRRNIKLASEALSLATAVHEHKNVEGCQFRSEIALLEDQMKLSRHKWRVMKGAAGAIVAGSGIAWVRDARLRDLVLDPPD